MLLKWKKIKNYLSTRVNQQSTTKPILEMVKMVSRDSSHVFVERRASFGLHLEIVFKICKTIIKKAKKIIPREAH